MFNFFKKLPSQERNNRDKREITSEKYTKWEDNEKIDKNLDPLNEWHDDNLDYAGGRELTEDEILVLENDTDRWKIIEEFTNDESLDNWQANEKLQFPDLETLYDLNKIYHIESQVRAAKREQEELIMESQNRNRELDSPENIDDYNLMQELAIKKQQRNLKESPSIQKETKTFEEQIKNLPTYSSEEFDVMLKSFTYLQLLEKNPKLESVRPVYADGNLIKDVDIAKEAGEYNKLKKYGGWSKYNKTDIELMKECAKWKNNNDFISQHAEFPKNWDGEILSKEEVKELASEITLFAQENPNEFIKNMINRGNWNKDTLHFKQKTFKGKDQWVAYKKIKKENTDGSQSDIILKYISTEKPSQSEKNNIYVYVVKNEVNTDSDKILFINTIDTEKVLKMFTINKKESEKVTAK